MANKIQLENYSPIIRQDMLVTLSKNFPLGEIEMNIFYLLVSQVKPQDPPGLEYTIPIKHVEHFTGRVQKMERLHAACESLRKKELKIVDKEMDFVSTGLLAEAYKIKGEKTLRVSLSNYARKFYVNLKERFSTFELEKLLKLKGRHSKRLYILLSAFRDTGFYHTSFENLVEILAKKIDADGNERIANYKTGNFKSEVLLPSQKEINTNTDLKFDIEYQKTGRKVTHYRFTIEFTGEERDFVKKYRENEHFNRLTAEFGLSAFQAKEVVDLIPPQEIKLICRTIQLANTNNEIRVIGAYTVKRIKEAYPNVNI